jgi:hypothetical protein
MRNLFFLLVSVAVIAGGIYAGRRDFERARDSAAAISQLQPPSASKEPPRQAGEDSTDAPAAVAAAPEPPPARGPSQSELAELIRRLERRAIEESFSAGARSAGEELARFLDEQPALRGDPALLEALAPLRRWELKAQVFDALVKPIAREELPDQVTEILLANGNRIMARKAVLQGDRYEVELIPSGITSLSREKVSTTQRFSKADYIDRAWAEVSKSIDKLSSPIDLYVKGVTRCFRWGLRERGYQLLERLLALPDSHQVPLVFADDGHGDIARRWEQAAGRMALDPPSGAVSSTAAPASSGAAADAPPSPAADAAGSLQEARALMQKAAALYQRVVVGHQGDLKDLHAAREDLERAIGILIRLPRQDERVARSRSEAVQLLHAVIKALPF